MFICFDNYPTGPLRHECGAFLTTVWEESEGPLVGGHLVCNNKRCTKKEDE